MTSARTSSAIVTLILGFLLGGAAGYLVAHAWDQSPASTKADHSAELGQIRAELAEIKTQVTPADVNEQLAQLRATVGDILLRGDEFALRADFARTANQLDGHSAADFALRDADGDGTDDLEQVRRTLEGILSGTTPVGNAKKADAAGNTEFLGNLAMTDFALDDHTHPILAGDVRMLDNVRIEGTLAVTGNTIASGNLQVFGEVVAVGGLMPGEVNLDPKPDIAGLIRYNRRTGALEYCDGTRWNEIAVVSQP
jgi:hypothetical protein